MSYSCFVAQVDCIEEIPGADKIQVGIVLGTKVIISKEWSVGDLGLFFPTDVQLSEEFCHHNNLFRDSTKNKDKSRKGFFDDNRRVRAQPFMGVKSEGFFCGMDALDYTLKDGEIVSLIVGESFTTYMGNEVCTRYESERAKAAKLKAANSKQKPQKVSAAPDFAKHCDTQQFKMFAQNIPAGALVSIHAKVHGTSARYAHLPVTRRQGYSKFVRGLRKFVGLPTEKVSTQYEFIAGTRNVLLLEDQRETREGFHGKEEYRYEILDQLKPYLSKGMTVYGEIAGFANGKSIMPKHSTLALKDKKFRKKYGEEISYTYGCKETEYCFHIYRITQQNAGGDEIDYTSKQLEQWCEYRGFLPSKNVCDPFIYDGDVESLREKVEQLTEREDVLSEDYIDPTHISEGVIVRVDYGNLRPIFYKSKSYAFKVMEGIQKESSDEVDVEELS